MRPECTDNLWVPSKLPQPLLTELELLLRVATGDDTPVLEARGLTKDFPGVRALDGSA